MSVVKLNTANDPILEINFNFTLALVNKINVVFKKERSRVDKKFCMYNELRRNVRYDYVRYNN